MKNQSKGISQRDLWKNALSKKAKDLECFAYLTTFREKYEEALKKDYSVKLTVIPFDGGSIIENKIVKKDRAQTIKLEKIHSINEAFRVANLTMVDPGNDINGTCIILNGDISYLIKDNSTAEWKPEKAITDIVLMTKDLLPSFRKSRSKSKSIPD